MQTGLLQHVVGGVDSPSKHTSHSPSMCGGLFVNLCIGGWRYIRSSEEDGSSLAVEVEGVLSVEEEEEEVVAAVAAVVVVEEEEEEVVAAVAAVEEEEEPALGFENTVELVAAAVEEEDAVAACVVAVEG